MSNSLNFSVNIVLSKILMNITLAQMIIKSTLENTELFFFFLTKKSKEEIPPLPHCKMHYNVAVIKMSLSWFMNRNGKE